MCFLAGLSSLWWSQSMSVAEHPMFAELPFCWVGSNIFLGKNLVFFWLIIISIRFWSHFSWLSSLIIALFKATVRQVDGITALSLARKASTAEGVRFDFGLFWMNGKKHNKNDGVLHTKAWKMVNSSKFCFHGLKFSTLRLAAFPVRLR
jgi:hypothetical protein